MKIYSVFVSGASRGLGLQFIRYFRDLDKAPRHIFAACRDPSHARELQELGASDRSHSTVHIIPLDVCNDESILSAVKYVEGVLEGAGLSLLINNAGTIHAQDLSTITSQALLEQFHVNSVAPLMLTKAFLPLLKQAAASTSSGDDGPGSVVLNMTSILASLTNAPNSPKYYGYNSSKCALNMITRILAADLAPSRVMVVSIHPGWVKTDMGGKTAPMKADTSVSSIMKTLESLTSKDSGTFINFNGNTLPW